MMDRNEDQFDDLLTHHLSDALDGQLGRAAGRFRRETLSTVASARAAEKSRAAGMRAWWGLGLVGSALAASVVIVMIFQSQLDRPAPGGGPIQMVEGAVPDEEVARTVVWQTLDEGTVFARDDTPLRRLRHQQVDTFEWQDRSGAQIEVSVPRERLVLVGMNRF